MSASVVIRAATSGVSVLLLLGFGVGLATGAGPLDSRFQPAPGEQYVWLPEGMPDPVLFPDLRLIPTRTGAKLALARTQDLRLMVDRRLPFVVLGPNEAGLLVTGRLPRPAPFPPPAAVRQQVAVIVDESAYVRCSSEVSRYELDVEGRFNADLAVYHGTWPDAESLRSFIKALWVADDIDGVIQIGRLPCAMWELSWDEACPIPLFYEDLDAEFLDRNSDGRYDWHGWGPSDEPEVWCAFMRPALGRLDDIADYLDKCHRYFADSLAVPRRAQVVCNRDWGGAVAVMREALAAIYGSAVDTVGGIGVRVSGQSYCDGLARGYGVSNVWVHSGATTHFFDTLPHDAVYDDEVRELTPGAAFSVLWACHGANWDDSPEHSFSEAYIFNSGIGMAAQGVTRSYGTPMQEVLFPLLAGSASLADAWRTYLHMIYDSSAVRLCLAPGDTSERFVYDVALLGNPFWTPNEESPVEPPEPSYPPDRAELSQSYVRLLCRDRSGAESFFWSVSDSGFVVDYGTSADSGYDVKTLLRNGHEYAWTAKVLVGGEWSDAFAPERTFRVNGAPFSWEQRADLDTLTGETRISGDNPNRDQGEFDGRFTLEQNPVTGGFFWSLAPDTGCGRYASLDLNGCYGADSVDIGWTARGMPGGPVYQSASMNDRLRWSEPWAIDSARWGTWLWRIGPDSLSWGSRDNFIRVENQAASDANLGLIGIRLAIHGARIRPDAGVSSLVAPAGIIDSGTAVTPRAVVRNCGIVGVIPLVRLTIAPESGDPVYEDSLVVSVPAGESVAAAFSEWTATPPGSYVVLAYASAAGDSNVDNDTCRAAFTVQSGTGVADLAQPPREFALDRAAPDPFTGRTRISYALPRESDVRLQILDASGRVVWQQAARRQRPGWYSIPFPGADEELPGGVYFCRFRAGAFTATRKLIRLVRTNRQATLKAGMRRT